MKKTEVILWSLCGLLLGVVIGFLIAPIKKGIEIGNNSGNNCGNKNDYYGNNQEQEKEVTQ